MVLQSDSSQMLSHLFPLQPGSLWPPLHRRSLISGTASPIPWWILSVVLKKGKWVLLFSLPSSVGGGITVAMTPLDAFDCTGWAFPNHFCCYCKLHKWCGCSHNFTSHITDRFLLKQGLTHSVLEDTAFLPADVSSTIGAILSESLLGLKCDFFLMLFFSP